MKSYKFNLIGRHCGEIRMHRMSKQNYSTLCDCQMAGLLNITKFAHDYPSVSVVELGIIDTNTKPLRCIARYTFDVSQLQNEIVHFSLHYPLDECGYSQHSIMLTTEQKE